MQEETRMMNKMITLSNGVCMPLIGYGTAGLKGEEAYTCTLKALSCGYRMVDTAHMYENEDEIGAAIKDSGLPREDIFIVSKVDSRSDCYDKTKQQISNSLRRLKTTYIDLYLIHEPYDASLDMWKALEEAYKAGILRAIGISNFYGSRYHRFMASVQIKPMVNQMETHIYFQQIEFHNVLSNQNVALMSWSPLAGGEKKFHEEEVLKKIAFTHGKTVAQIVLGYLASRNIAVIPKTRKFRRMEENFDIFNLKLSKEEITSIQSLDQNKTLFEWTNEFK